MEMTKRVINFRLATNTLTGQPMVEVWRDNKFVASIYGHEEGVQLVSKYFDGVEYKADYPPAIVVKLLEQLK